MVILKDVHTLILPSTGKSNSPPFVHGLDRVFCFNNWQESTSLGHFNSSLERPMWLEIEASCQQPTINCEFLKTSEKLRLPVGSHVSESPCVRASRPSQAFVTTALFIS